jgi:hypothetical protein
VPLFYGADERSLCPEAVLLNAVVEKNPVHLKKPVTIRARPGLDAFVEIGSGHRRGVAHAEGLFDGDVLGVFGTELWRLKANGQKTLVSGTVAGDEEVRIVIGQNSNLDSVARIATGDALYVYVDGGSVTEEDFPTAGGAGASDVEYHRGDWLAIEAGTDKLWYLLPADTTWNALSFASAEYKADPLVFIRSRGDQIFLGGRRTTEVWVKTGEADPAYAPYGGLNFDYGARGRDAVASFAGSILWVDDAGSVRVSAGGEAQIISTSGIAEQMLAVDGDDIAAWPFKLDQHFFCVFNLGGTSTWVFDLAAHAAGLPAWVQWRSPGHDHWKPAMGLTAGDTILAFDHDSTQVWRLNADTHDDAGEPFSWEFMGRVENEEGVAENNNVELEILTGIGPRTGYGSDPALQMRFSDNEGRTWSRWRDRPMGATGEVKRPRWNALGSFERSRIFHFRCNAPIARRVTAIRMNVA